MSTRILTHRSPTEALQDAVQSIEELRLAPISDIDDKQGVYVEDETSLYFYDYDSELAESLPDVIEPTAGVGRWVRHGYLSAGTSGIYRRKWWQEGLITAGDIITIEAGSELIIQTLDVEGELDVAGTLILYDEGAGKWRTRWAQPTLVEVEEVVLLPEGQQLVVHEEFEVKGELEVAGQLIVLDLAPPVSTDPFTEYLLADGSRELAGDFIPDGDKTRNLGSAARRLNTIRAFEVVSGDLCFDDPGCVLCEKAFVMGDRIELMVRAVEPDALGVPVTKCVPVHRSCADRAP